MGQKTAFLLAFPIRTAPSLITMPFGINIIQILDKKGVEIDVYLSEYKSNVYDGLFSNRVCFKFLDSNYLWPKEGIQSFYALTIFFNIYSLFKLRNKYSHIYGSGMAGVKLADTLKKRNKKATFYYLNDELPGENNDNIWIKGEKNAASNADIIISPDETRIPPLLEQIPALINKPAFVLPNSPLLSDFRSIPRVDWHEKFAIEKNKKLFLVAGGLSSDTMIEQTIHSVMKWPKNTVLIVKGKHHFKSFEDKYSKFLNSDNIIFFSEELSPPMLHSLIQYCNASICIYNPRNANLKYIGKSSGKMMRSLLLGRPVIVMKDNAMDFIKETGTGVVINDVTEIPKGIYEIQKKEATFIKSCEKNKKMFTFEFYWESFQKTLNHSERSNSENLT